LNDVVNVVSFETNIPDSNYVPASGGTFAGNVSMSGTLGVTGATTLTGNSTVGGTLGVTGATTLSSTLGVTGKITSTAGITFGSDTAAANVLDDYEEGICTIAATCDSGSVTFETNGDAAFYTKIGRLVTVGGRLDVASVSSPSGQLRLTGLPYPALFGGSGELGGQNAVTIILFSPGVDIQENLCAEITNTFTTSILIRDRMGATGGVQGIASHVDAGSLFAFQATYVAA